MKTKTQITVFIILLAFNAIVAGVAAVLNVAQPVEGLAQANPAAAAIPPWQLALGTVGLILVMYGLLGVLGFWLSRKTGMPGIFRPEAGWKGLFWLPLLMGLGAGAILTAADRGFAALTGMGNFPHPAFPLSLLASVTAGIGEEILFRLFVMSLWAFLLNLLLRRWRLSNLALWIANGIAALAFAAGHLPSAMVLYGATTPAGIPVPVLVELVVLNGFVGMLAGWRFMRDGLVPAAGIHFWADVLWHVVFPLVVAV